MAWDIYGNVLAAGHCEVHPHVHEEWPCSLCIYERNEHEHAKEAYDAAMRQQWDEEMALQCKEHYEGQQGEGI